jgi:hypothetical protein
MDWVCNFHQNANFQREEDCMHELGLVLYSTLHSQYLKMHGEWRKLDICLWKKSANIAFGVEMRGCKYDL